MEPLSSLNDNIPSEFTCRYDRGYAGSIRPVQTTRQLHSDTTYRKNSKVRLNDQLVPKPTDINIGDKLLIPPLKQHPYLSHMSRFAVFPSFCSPDDPHTGVRAASQPFLQPRIPNSAPHVTVLSKAMGAPHRHEILESPMKARKKAVTWPGEHGFLDRTKQVFYPTPPTAVLPNATLRDWELSLPERSSNMLKNLERALWVTSYQTHYTGSGPANPLMIDDFKEKMSGPAAINSHSAPLRERSYPVFAASKPVRGCRRTESRSGPTTADPLSSSPGIVAKHNEEPALNPKGCSQSWNRTGSTEAERTEPPHEHNPSVYESRERDRCNVQADPTAALELEKLGDIGAMPSCISNPGVLPRPPGLPGARLPHGAGTVGGEGAARSLRDLQSSFSRSEAHRNFSSSVTRAAVNLRDNVVTGKKHNFYGINCCYLRG